MPYSSFRSIAKPVSLSLSLGCALLAACGGDESAAEPLADGPDAASTADAASQPGSDAGPGVDASTGSTIAGKVVWQYANVAGAKIVIGNKSATTDDKGAFAIADVALPYDLHVILPSEIALTGPKGSPTAYTYAGLSTTAPVLSPAAKVTYSTATFTGSVAKGSSATNSRYRVIASSPMSPPGGGYGGASNSPPKEYDLTHRWPLGQSAQSVTLIGIEYTLAPNHTALSDGIPVGYDFGAATLVPAEAGQTYTNQLSDFAPISNKVIQGTIELPAGYTLSRHLLHLVSTNGTPIEFTESTTASSFSYNVPDFAYLKTVHIGAVAGSGNGDYVMGVAKVTGGTSGIEVTLNKAPDLLTPAVDAAGVKPGDVLSWSSAGDACVYTAYVSSDGDGSTQFRLITTGTKIALPDLSAHGAGLAASASYKWSVTCNHQETAKASINEAVKLGVSYLSSSSTPQRSFLSQ